MELVQERVLFQFKDAITFKDIYIRLLDLVIESSVVIYIVSH
jgi:hypothetical protein